MPHDLLTHTAAMMAAYRAMSQAERDDLHAWERTHLDGHSVHTGHWPGWEKYIGPCPDPIPRPPTRPRCNLRKGARMA